MTRDGRSGWPARAVRRSARWSAGICSRRHRDDPGHGCLFAALGSEVVRQPRSVRRAVTEGLRSRVEA